MKTPNKALKVKVSDASVDQFDNLLLLLNRSFQIELVEFDPDYILHSSFGDDYLQFDCVRVAIIGKNLTPDFNLTDYASGFQRINYGDRHLRFPLFRWYFRDYDALIDGKGVCTTRGDGSSTRRDEFATVVVSNPNRDPICEAIFDALSSYRNVKSGGLWRNNVGGPVADKVEFSSGWKICDGR